MIPFTPPNWRPVVDPGMRILVTGASGGLGRALVDMLLAGPDCTIGAHGATQRHPSDDPRVVHLVQTFDGEEDCRKLVERFIEYAGGIDALVVLSGGIHFSGHWKHMPADKWERDMDVNMNQPFFLARTALENMRANDRGGRILLTGTESAIHGGSAVSFPYAIAKRGTECMVQGLAREGAPDGILVNGLRFGYIDSGFHGRWHEKTDADMQARAALVPLKRSGHVNEAAALMIFLLSGWTQFITGQMIPLTGGDWL